MIMQVSGYSYANGCLDLWTDLEKSKKFTSEDAENLEEIDAITIPIHYWSPQNRDKLPEYANVFRYGTYPLNRPRDDSAPDYTGRLQIEITSEDKHGNNWEKVKSALRRVNELFARREGYHSLLFQTFVPFSTRHFKDTCKSLFPFTGLGREHLASIGRQDEIGSSLIVGVVMLIADLATIAFRLIALIPRAIYQHHLQKNLSIQGILLLPKFGKGTIAVYTYTNIFSDRISMYTPPAFYLG
jgi:hypothetical protein